MEKEERMKGMNRDGESARLTFNENLEVIQTWFNSGSGMEAGVSQLI
jgi:hypothetical protein